MGIGVEERPLSMVLCRRKASRSPEAPLSPSSFPSCPGTVCGDGEKKSHSGGSEFASLKNSRSEGSAEIGGGLKKVQILSETARRSEDEDQVPLLGTKLVSCGSFEL